MDFTNSSTQNWGSTFNGSNIQRPSTTGHKENRQAHRSSANPEDKPSVDGSEMQKNIDEQFKNQMNIESTGGISSVINQVFNSIYQQLPTIKMPKKVIWFMVMMAQMPGIKGGESCDPTAYKNNSDFDEGFYQYSTYKNSFSDCSGYMSQINQGPYNMSKILDDLYNESGVQVEYLNLTNGNINMSQYKINAGKSVKNYIQNQTTYNKTTVIEQVRNAQNELTSFSGFLSSCSTTDQNNIKEYLSFLCDKFNLYGPTLPSGPTLKNGTTPTDGSNDDNTTNETSKNSSGHRQSTQNSDWEAILTLVALTMGMPLLGTGVMALKNNYLNGVIKSNQTELQYMNGNNNNTGIEGILKQRDDKVGVILKNSENLKNIIMLVGLIAMLTSSSTTSEKNGVAYWTTNEKNGLSYWTANVAVKLLMACLMDCLMDCCVPKICKNNVSTLNASIEGKANALDPNADTEIKDIINGNTDKINNIMSELSDFSPMKKKLEKLDAVNRNSQAKWYGVTAMILHAAGVGIGHGGNVVSPMVAGAMGGVLDAILHWAIINNPERDAKEKMVALLNAVKENTENRSQNFDLNQINIKMVGDNGSSLVLSDSNEG